MDEQTLEKNDVLQELLKSEYDLAKHECEYYTQEFNKQDTVYGVYFAVFSVVIGAIYKIAETNNDQLELTNLAVILNQKIIIGGMILFLAFAYIYVFLVIMGNSYYLILYSEKIMVLERILNHYLDKKIFVWESCVMEQIQTSVYKGYKQDKIEMRGDRAEMSDFPLYLNTVAGGLDRRDQTIGGFSFVVKIYAVPVVEIIG